MAVIKNLIAPFQQVLLSKKLCPGCTMPLQKGKKHDFKGDLEMIICSCDRMFIYDKSTDTYRRATLREGKMFAKDR
jgi:hypothetical protein